MPVALPPRPFQNHINFFFHIAAKTNNVLLETDEKEP